MKRVISIILLLISFCPSAYASTADMLSQEIICNDGLFFAYRVRFEGGGRLLIASEESGGVRIKVLDDEDGDAVDDELFISEDSKLSVIRGDECEYLLVGGSCFTLIDDTFLTCPFPVNYSVVIDIAAIRGGRINTMSNTKGAAYNLLNRMKLEMRCRFMDRKNSLSRTEYDTLRRTIAACADIMRYDSENYDCDRLMRYILNTCENFKIVSSLEPDIRKGEVNIVRAEYIEDIAQRLFGISPPRPYVNELITRGYCYNNGFYSYIDCFNVSFCTEIRDINRVYDAGSGIFYVVFSDIYTEGGVSVPEISYAIFDTSAGGYSLLKLDMGGSLPDEREVMRRGGINEYAKLAWEEKPQEDNENNFLAKLKKICYNIYTFFKSLITGSWIKKILPKGRE